MPVENLQIFGVKDCKDTQKAERFFKERNIKFQFRNLAEKGLSKGELESVKRKFSIDDLFNTEGKQYKKRNLQYIKFDKEEELLNDPLLFVTPIVRTKTSVTIGYCPDIWKEWLK
ncbi:MAG TPA: ArsC/Spx/MgsR family protein [Melioribacteraceae bacterium]|nr:ArsC/Spx/MgsR family protein [Melioribacteraceae bacterium]